MKKIQKSNLEPNKLIICVPAVCSTVMLCMQSPTPNNMKILSNYFGHASRLYMKFLLKTILQLNETSPHVIAALQHFSVRTTI